MPTREQFITQLKSKIGTRVMKIEAVDNDDNVLYLIDDQRVIAGDLNKSGGKGARRGGSLSFDNEDDIFTPAYNGLVWGRKRLRISTGMLIDADNGNPYYYSHGTFVMGNVRPSSKESSEVEVDLLDKYNLLDGEFGGTTDGSVTIDVGTSISDAVQAVLTLAGETKAPIIYPTAVTLPYTITKEAGSTYSEILEELADMLSWTCYYDNDGYFRFEPEPSLDTQASVWSFDVGDPQEATILSSESDIQFTNMANNIVVIGDSVNDVTVRAVATDNSTGRGFGVSEIGVITRVISDSLIYNISLAQQRADAELNLGVLSPESIDLSIIHVDILEGEHIIELTNEKLGITTPQRYKIGSLSFPLMVSGDMSVSASRERTLS